MFLRIVYICAFVFVRGGNRFFQAAVRYGRGMLRSFAVRSSNFCLDLATALKFCGHLVAGIAMALMPGFDENRAWRDAQALAEMLSLRMGEAVVPWCVWCRTWDIEEEGWLDYEGEPPNGWYTYYCYDCWMDHEEWLKCSQCRLQMLQLPPPFTLNDLGHYHDGQWYCDDCHDLWETRRVEAAARWERWIITCTVLAGGESSAKQLGI